MREHAQFVHHVHHPDDVGIQFFTVNLVLIRAIVFAVVKAFRVETHDFAAIRHHVHAAAFHAWCRTDSLFGPVVDSAGRQFFSSQLPQEFSISLAEAQHNSPVTDVLFAILAAVVRAHIDATIRDNRIAVGL